jgi:hypothetical protein
MGFIENKIKKKKRGRERSALAHVVREASRYPKKEQDFFRSPKKMKESRGRESAFSCFKLYDFPSFGCANLCVVSLCFIA